MAMKPRELVPFVSISPNVPTLEQTVHELRTELHHTRMMLNEERLARSQAEAHVTILQRNRDKKPKVPGGDADYGYECGNPYCVADIQSSWDYCPFCGCEIDWRTWVDEPNEDDYTAHTAVTRPLKEIAAEIRKRQAV